MKIGKKIYSLILVLFSAVCAFAGCGKDPYEDMTLTVNTNSINQVYSADDLESNYFDIVATVEGVDAEEVNTNVQFVISNTEIIDFASDSVVEGTSTTQKFAVKTTGKTTILVTTMEGGSDGIKRQVVNVNITSPILALNFTYDTLPIIRNVRTDLTTNVYDGSGYLTYTNPYTTERDVTLEATTMAGVKITEGVIIEDNAITVTDESINNFKIKATSKYNPGISDTAMVQVLEPIQASDFTITHVKGGESSVLGTALMNGVNTYVVNLANADSVVASENNKTLDVLYDGASITADGSGYTLKARNLNISETGISGLNYMSARKNENGTFTLGEGRGQGTDQIVFLVYYKGYENIFAPVQLPLSVTVSSYPTDINFVDDMNLLNVLENIDVYKDSNYHKQLGTSMHVQVANSNGDLIGQNVYVYAVDNDGKKVSSGIQIYHFVNGSTERVYANTPIKHGEQIIINYVYSADFVNGKIYKIVAESTLFEGVRGEVGVNLITDDINVSISLNPIEKGTLVELDAKNLLGNENPQISLSELNVTSNNSEVLKVFYDTDKNVWVLDAVSTSKIGTAIIAVTAPNGKTASTSTVVYMPTNIENTTLTLGNVTVRASESAEISIISGSSASVIVNIAGQSYNILPSGINIVANDENLGQEDVVSFSQDYMTIYSLNETGQARVVYTLKNIYTPDADLTFTFIVSVQVPIKKLNINTQSADIYAIDSVSMAGYENYGRHIISVTPYPENTVINENFGVRVRYDGTFYQSKFSSILNRYTFSITSDFVVYVTLSAEDPTQFVVTNTLGNQDKNIYTFEVYIGYTEIYQDFGGEISVTVSNYVQITTQNAVKISEIYDDLGNKNIDFDTNKLVKEGDNWTAGNVKAFNFTINPKADNVFESKVMLISTDDSGAEGNANLTLYRIEYIGQDEKILTYRNSYLAFEINNYTGRVTITLNTIPTDNAHKIMNFALVALDSEFYMGDITYYGTYKQFSVKINDGSSRELAFTISNGEDLANIANALDSYYVLANDIYMDSYLDFAPIGSEAEPFTGYLYGSYKLANGNYKHYEIKNLNLVAKYNPNSSDEADTKPSNTTIWGLIAVNKGVIEDVTLRDALVRFNYRVSDTSNAYVGALSGINYGTITNCQVITRDFEINDNYLNTITATSNPTSGVVVRDYSANTHYTFVGGVTGANFGEILDTKVRVNVYANDNRLSGSTVYAGGVAGVNSITKVNEEEYAGVINYSNSSTNYKNFDVVMTFNAGQLGADNLDDVDAKIYNLTNENSVVGGIAGLNSDIENFAKTASINNIFARVLIVGCNNVGGVVGINTAQIKNITIQPTIIAENKVGGVAGVNYDGSYNVGILTCTSVYSYEETANETLSLLNVDTMHEGDITNTKVQFVNNNYTVSKFNTGIKANSYVGGLIGANYGEDRSVDAMGVWNAINYNSVYSYITSTATAGYSDTNISSAFYGDIVATGMHIGGLIGASTNTYVSSNLVNVTAQVIGSGIYGGIIGKAINAMNIVDSQVAGSVVATNVGSMVGDASEIADTLGYALGVSESGEILTTDTSELINHPTVTDVNYHINTTYSLLKYDNGAYVANFAHSGTTKDGTQNALLRYVTEEDGITYVNYFDSTGVQKEEYTIPTDTDGNSVDVGNVYGQIRATRNLLTVANSFYIGFNTLINNNSEKVYTTFNINDAQKLGAYYGYTSQINDDESVTYTKSQSHYDNLTNYFITVENNYTYADFGLAGEGNVLKAGDILRYVNNDITSNASANVSNYNIYLVNDDVTGLGSNYTYQKLYMNKDIFGGLPVAFAPNGIKEGKLYLVYDIAPSSIILSINSEYKGSSLVGENEMAVVAIGFGYYADEDGNEILRSYKLSDLISRTIIPAFAEGSKVKIVSDNTNMLMVSDNAGEIYVTPLKTGVTKLRIYSTYDYQISAEVTVYIYNYVYEWNLTRANGEQINNDDTLVITKGTATLISSQLVSDYPNAITGVAVTATGDDLSYLKINNIALDANKIINFDTTNLSFNGFDKTGSNINLELQPYIKYVKDGVTFIKYLNFHKEISVKVVLGSFALNVPGNMTLNPTGTINFDVVASTDNEELALVYGENSNSEQVAFTVYRDGKVVDFANEDTLDLGYVAGEYNTTTGNITFNFVASVKVDKYSEISSNINYKFVVELLRYDGKIITKEFNLTIIPQQLSTIVITHYSRVGYFDEKGDEIDKENVSDQLLQAYKYASDTIVPGYSGLMQFNLHPEYGQYDYVTITSSRSGIAFEQMIERANLGEYSEYSPYYEGVTNVANGIRIANKYSATDNEISTDINLVYVYNGRLYVRTNASSSLQNGSVTITINCYLADGTNVFTATKDLIVVEAPYVNVGVGENYADKNAPIATGTSIMFRIQTAGVVMDPVLNNPEHGSIYSRGNGLYEYVMNNTGSVFDLYNLLGSEISITAEVSKTINNRTYKATDEIILRVVKYVVTDVRVEYVVNGKFTGKYNQIYQLRSIVSAKYNEQLYEFDYTSITKGDDTLTGLVNIKNDIANLQANIDSYGLVDYILDGNKYFTANSNNSKNPITKSWYIVNGSSITAIEAKTYQNFIARYSYDNTSTEQVFSTMSIQNIVASARDTLMLNVRFTYAENGIVVISTDNDNVFEYQNSKDNNINYTYSFPREFTFDFTRIVDEENPDPIVNAEQFLAMQKGGHYILQNDIVLENWVPKEANFASLDGNMFVVTIKSFADLADIYSAGTETINLGLFSSISGMYNENDEDSPTIIKNLNIEIPYDITLNISQYKNVYFGVLAGSNEGVVTNCQVINNATANKIITERNQIIGGLASDDILTELGSDEIVIEYMDVAQLSDYINNRLGVGVAINNAPTVYLSQNSTESNTSKNNYIAGFVGNNSGYITNSAIESISIKGTDYVGGFVAINNKIISTSYFKDANVISIDSATKSNSGTAGFVAVNSANGSIQYSYVQGLINGTDITGMTQEEKAGFAGYVYREDEYLGQLRAMNSMVSTNNYAGAFVYNNNGYINNSYANILVSGTRSAGFAYTNNGADSYIEACYTLSSGKIKDTSFTPFTQKVSANVTSTKIKDCYYLQVDSRDTNIAEYYDEFSNIEQSEGVALNAVAFSDYNSFQSYAFNTDYIMNSEQTITQSVWFIPNVDTDENIYKNYFKHDTYSNNRPELVGANIRATRFRAYQITNQGTELEKEKGFKYYDATTRQGYLTNESGEVTNVDIDMSYGTSVINPYLIDSAYDFNNYTTPTETKDENKTVTQAHLRFIKDIAFDNVDQTAQTYNRDFKGDIDGNGLSINNLRILADTSVDGETNVNENYFGLFATISSSTTIDQNGKEVVVNWAVVRNLNINIEEIWGVNVKCVGVLAGKIEDGVVVNVSVNGTNITVEGLNAVGGVAGIVQGQSFLVNTTSNVSVKANYRGNVNLFSANNSINTRVTTYKLFNENIPSGEESGVYDVDGISYAGGIAGIIVVDENPDVHNSLRNFGRARRNYVEGGVVIDAQVVGGLFAYIGSNTTVSDSYVLVNEFSKLNATRVAGGIAGHNLGVIQRSYLVHESATQDSIDAYLSNKSNIAKVDNATTDIIISGMCYEVFGKNPHYIGGLVGININGEIRNSYNKVPVANINAEYAGGIIGINVGGELNGVYTTATVYAFRGIGGIVGINTYTVVNYDDTGKEAYKFKFNSTNAFEENIYKLCNTDDKLELRNVVGANIWLASHTNINRNLKYQYDANNAVIGSLAGITTFEFSTDSYGGFTVDLFASRAIAESVYLKTQWTYASKSASAREIIREIGDIGDDDINYNVYQSTILEEYATDAKIKAKMIFTKGTYETQENVTKNLVRMLSGIYQINGIESDFHYSRLQVLSSSRTLQEIVDRIANFNSADSTYSTFGVTQTNSNCDYEKEASLATDPNITPVRSKIYNYWSTAEWDGIGVDDAGNKVDSKYVFPVLSNKAEPTVINVYTEADIRLMETYLYSDFVLQNDIYLTMLWNPVGSKDKPFRGRIYSSRISGDTYNDYTISNLIIDNAISDTTAGVGLIAYAEGAYLHHFNLAVTEVKGVNNVSALIGIDGDESVIDNVDITSFVNEGSAHHLITNATGVDEVYSGTFVANGNKTIITNSTLSDIVSSINYQTFFGGATSTDPHYVGGVFGKINDGWINELSVQGCNVTFNAKGDLQGDLWIGSIGGYIELKTEDSNYQITGLDSDTSLVKVDVQNVNANVYIGGAFGEIVGNDVIITQVDEYGNNSAIVYSPQITGTCDLTYPELNFKASAKVVRLGGFAGKTNNVDFNNSYVSNYFPSSPLAIKHIKFEKFYYSAFIAECLNASIDNSYVNNALLGNYSTATEIEVNNAYIGGLIGYADNCNINNSYVSDTTIAEAVNGYSYVGGIVGCAQTTNAENCYVLDCDITSIIGVSYVGGITGYWNNGADCTLNKVVVDEATSIHVELSSSYVGGLVGIVFSSGESTINESASGANITVNASGKVAYIGGLVGHNTGSGCLNITYSYSSSTINDTQLSGYNEIHYIGGLVGYNDYKLNIEYSYSISNITTDFSNVNYDRFSYYSSDVLGGTNTTNLDIVATYYTHEINPFANNKYGTGITALDFMTDRTINLYPTIGDWIFSYYSDEDGYSYPVLHWMQGVALLEHFQAEGTKVNPATYTDAILEGGDSLDNKAIVVNTTTTLDGIELVNTTVYLKVNFTEITNCVSIDANSAIIGIDNNGEDSSVVNELNLVMLTWRGELNGKLVRVNTEFSRAYTNKALIFASKISGLSYVFDQNNGIIDSSILNGSNLVHYASSGLITNSKITNNVEEYPETNCKIKDSYKMYGSGASAHYYSPSGTKLEISSVDFNAVSNYYGKIDFDKFLLINGITNIAGGQEFNAPADGVMRLRWEFKKNWYDEEIDNKYFWSSTVKDAQEGENADYDINGSSVVVYTAKGLAKLQDLINEDDITTITLGANIDLMGKLWTPIVIEDITTEFTFNGLGRTISNMTVAESSTDGAGFFGKISNATKNVNIINIKFEYANIVNQTVTDSLSDTGNIAYAGVVIGVVSSGTNVNIDKVAINKCSLLAVKAIKPPFSDASFVKGYAGGMIGRIGTSNPNITDSYTVNPNITDSYTVLVGNTPVQGFIGYASSAKVSISTSYNVFVTNRNGNLIPTLNDTTAYLTYFAKNDSLTLTNVYVGNNRTYDRNGEGNLQSYWLPILQNSTPVPGFAWNTTWIRYDNSDDPNWNLPQLVDMQQTWQQWASENEDEIGELWIESVKTNPQAVSVNSAEQLAWVAWQLSEEDGIFTEQTNVVIYVDDSIDLSGKLWGTITIASDTIANLEIEGGGQKQTISNMTTLTGGFITNLDSHNIAISELIFDNSYVWADDSDAGVIVSQYEGGAITLSGINITNSTISGSKHVGALIAYATSAEINNCNLTNISINADSATDGACAGVLAGYLEESSINSCNIKDSIIIARIYENIGGLIGRVSDSNISNIQVNTSDIDTTDCENVSGVVGNVFESTITNVTYDTSRITAEHERDNMYVGGVVGRISSISTSSKLSDVYINNNEINAFIATTTNYALNVGGVVGYATSASNTSRTLISQLIVGNVSNVEDYYEFNDSSLHITYYITNYISSTIGTTITANAKTVSAGGVIGYLDTYVNANELFARANLTIGNTTTSGSLGGIIGTSAGANYVGNIYTHSDKLNNVLLTNNATYDTTGILIGDLGQENTTMGLGYTNVYNHTNTLSLVGHGNDSFARFSKDAVDTSTVNFKLFLQSSAWKSLTVNRAENGEGLSNSTILIPLFALPEDDTDRVIASALPDLYTQTISINNADTFHKLSDRVRYRYNEYMYVEPNIVFGSNITLTDIIPLGITNYPLRATVQGSNTINITLTSFNTAKLNEIGVTQDIGLIGYKVGAGEIKNLHVSLCKIAGLSTQTRVTMDMTGFSNVGAVVGRAECSMSNVTVGSGYNTTSASTLTATSYLGSIVGYISSSSDQITLSGLKNSYTGSVFDMGSGFGVMKQVDFTRVTLFGREYVGGLIGYAKNIKLINSGTNEVDGVYETLSINGLYNDAAPNQYFGGMVGYADNCTIGDSEGTNALSVGLWTNSSNGASYKYFGGVVGYAYNTTIQYTTLNSVGIGTRYDISNGNPIQWVGGIAGGFETSSNTITINDCVISNGELYGTNVGGVIGYAKKTTFSQIGTQNLFISILSCTIKLDIYTTSSDDNSGQVGLYVNEKYTSNYKNVNSGGSDVSGVNITYKYTG